MIGQPPGSTLFPYTAVFRSVEAVAAGHDLALGAGRAVEREAVAVPQGDQGRIVAGRAGRAVIPAVEHRPLAQPGALPVLPREQGPPPKPRLPDPDAAGSCGD